MKQDSFFPDGFSFEPNGRVVVTGGAGFIGSALVGALLEHGCSVTCLDNFSTGFRSNIAPFCDHPRFRLIEGDLRSADDCRRACEEAEYVLHEAALGSVPRSIADPESTVAVNVTGTVNLFSAAHKAGVRRVVYASSSSVYGDDSSEIKHEKHTGHPLSPYAASKACCEIFSANFAHVYHLPSVGLRYFNVFGPRQNPAGAYAAVIPKFALALLRHETPVINGDGSISRDFTFVANVVEANLRALTAPDAPGKAFNIGCGESWTLNELFTILRDALAQFDPHIAPLDVRHGPERPGDIHHSRAGIEQAEQILGYHPRISFREGILLTAEYFFRSGQTQI